MGKKLSNKSVIVYQASSGAVEICLDTKKETILLTQQQVGQLFDVKKAAISKHVKNIFSSGELAKHSTVSILETVQREGKREILRKIEYYNLDLILSIGYRVNSKKATKFRQWATKTLRAHIVNGYTINRTRIAKNYEKFLEAVDSVKKLLPSDDAMGAKDTLELIKLFADTWFSLNAYDASTLPSSGANRRQARLAAEELEKALTELRRELIAKKQASDLFGAGRHKDAVAGIVGNVLQSFGGKDLYPTIEEKAAHLLYFIVKNHPFTDGNKRCGAFALVWFLSRAKALNRNRLTPEALTALTLLVAESSPKEKARMVGLMLLILRK